MQKPLGINYLANMLPRICKLAGRTESYTNHCLRATTIQKLSDAGLESKEIMSVTGHKNESSLRSYWRPNMDERRNWSTVLSTSSAVAAAGPQKRPLPTPEQPDCNTPTPPKRCPGNYFYNCTFSGNVSVNTNDK